MPLQPELIVAVSHKGKREENQDFIIPSKVPSQSLVYVVCDGVGGNHKGEIASKIVAESIDFYLRKKNPVLFLTKPYLTKSLRFAEERLSEYIDSHPNSKGMASTVVCLEFAPKKAMGYWVGDSKLFHIRKNKILFESKDHSLYEELKNQPETDKKKLDEFPFKNYILRAVKGNHHPAEPEHFILNDLQVGDYFILVTDGILEGVNINELIQILEEVDETELIKSKIIEQCELRSKDNYSLQIIKLMGK